MPLWNLVLMIWYPIAFDCSSDMAEIHRQAVILRHEAAGASAGELHVQVFDNRDRMRRAVLAWLACWGLALASLPIIFAHWVLVPGFLLAGPFIAYRYYHVISVSKKITGTCPSCAQDMELGLETSDQLPMWRYCPLCHESLYIIEGIAGQE
jgi:hypothetical protein